MTDTEAISAPSRWQILSDEWAQSNLSQKVFCQQKGIAYKTFVRHRMQLNKSKTTKSKTGLTKLQITPTPQRSPLPGIHIACPNGTQLTLSLRISKPDLEWILIKLGVC